MTSRVLGLSIAVAVLLVDATAAQALRYKQCNIRATEPCTADVFPGKVTVLSFESTVHSVYTAQTAPRFVIEKYSHEVTVEARPGADYTNIEIQLDERKLGVLVNVVDSFEKHDGRIEFYDPLKHQEERTKVVAQEFDSYLAGMIMHGFDVEQTRLEPVGPDRPLPLSIRLATLRMGHEVKLVMTLTNVGDEPVPLEAIRVTSPGRLDNQVGFIRVESGQPARGRRLADIYPGDTAQAYIALKDPLALGRMAILTLLAATGQSQSTHIQIWPPPDGPSNEELERQRRGRQVILGPTVALGGCWLADGIDGASTPEAMTCTMVGLRATKGFIENAAFEGEVIGGWTDTNDRGGAKFGRATGSAVLRFGASIMPFFRVGIGGQAARVGADTDFALLLGVATGVDWRLSEHFVVGASLAWQETLTAAALFRRSLGLGVHLSYGWNTDSTRQ